MTRSQVCPSEKQYTLSGKQPFGGTVIFTALSRLDYKGPIFTNRLLGKGYAGVTSMTNLELQSRPLRLLTHFECSRLLTPFWVMAIDSRTFGWSRGAGQALVLLYDEVWYC
jgi:hypothetical protein